MSGRVRLCKKLKIRIKKPLDSQAVLLFCLFADFLTALSAKKHRKAFVCLAVKRFLFLRYLFITSRHCAKNCVAFSIASMLTRSLIACIRF